MFATPSNWTLLTFPPWRCSHPVRRCSALIFPSTRATSTLAQKHCSARYITFSKKLPINDKLKEARPRKRVSNFTYSISTILSTDFGNSSILSFMNVGYTTRFSNSVISTHLNSNVLLPSTIEKLSSSRIDSSDLHSIR